MKEEITELRNKLRNDMKQKYDRILPFNEFLFDRWEKARFLNAGEGTSIYDNCYIFGDVKIGKNTWIGMNTILDGSGGITIGDNCSISAGVQLYTHNTVDWALTGGKAKFKKDPITIGNCCYIGPNSIISLGVKIGNHCLIGANSLIRTHIPDNSIAFGTPGKVAGKVIIDKDEIKLEYFPKPTKL
jgi:acetyltransferase-like isoleucine patch superfamily enzyme